MAYNSTVSSLQLYTPAGGKLSGLVESNKLYNAFVAEPTKMRAVMARAFGQMKGKEDILDMLTNGTMQTETISSEVYRWPLYTKDSELVEVAGAALDGGSYPGLGNSTFRVPFAEKFFELGSNLRADDNTMCRVQEDPYQDGNLWIYTLVLNNSNPAAYIEPAMVTYGARFLQVWGDYEEYSDGGIGVAMSTPAMLENQLQTFRSKASVTRNGSRTKLAMDIMSTDPKTNKGKVVSTVWAEEVVWKTYEQHRRDITWAMIYSNKSTHRIGANGRPVKAGAGFHEQISPANVWEYSGNELDYDLFVDFIENLERIAIDNGGQPELVCLTGRDGMAKVDRMLAKRFKDKGLVAMDSHFIKGDGNGSLTLNGYFRGFTTESGITVKFKNFAPYNDAEFNRQKNPITGNPLESSTFTVLNFGTDAKGNANIKKIYYEGAEGMMWSVGGSMNASGERKSKSSEGASGIDGFDVYFLDQCGLKMSDPTSCGMLQAVGIKRY